MNVSKAKICAYCLFTTEQNNMTIDILMTVDTGVEDMAFDILIIVYRYESNLTQTADIFWGKIMTN